MLIVAMIGLGAVLLPAAPASAHAALTTATPEPGSVVATAPGEITLTFTEGITPVPDRTQVLAPDGKRITGAVAAIGSTLRIQVRRADQPLGTYLVSYRIVS
ncbi:copper resistance CopC family protein, partial [Actinoplanes sp. NPDC048791]|uniref:copper resistance CopC family protein n=1 Tax=Actinoplanes sp. NPDC048791 TaxID=3154623 RepID=UPI0033C9FD2E